MKTQSAKIFNVTFDGSQPVVALVGKKRYTFIARFRGLIGETLFAAMDEKNNYRVLDYKDINTKEITIIG